MPTSSAIPPPVNIPPPDAHHLLWKGKRTGPHTRAELETKLANGEISLIHRVETDGHTQPLGEFLGFPPPPRPNLFPENTSSISAATLTNPEFPTTPALATYPPREPTNSPPAFAFPPPATRHPDPEHLEMIAYILCGACFILPLLATTPALFLALHIQSRGGRVEARRFLILAPLFTILGILFYLFLYSSGFWK